MLWIWMVNMTLSHWNQLNFFENYTCPILSWSLVQCFHLFSDKSQTPRDHRYNFMITETCYWKKLFMLYISFYIKCSSDLNVCILHHSWLDAICLRWQEHEANNDYRMICKPPNVMSRSLKLQPFFYLARFLILSILYVLCHIPLLLWFTCSSYLF